MIDEGTTVRVTDDRAHNRYEARIGHALAGLATYELTPGRITFLHTRTEPVFQGRGVASRLAEVNAGPHRKGQARDEQGCADDK